VSVKSSTGLPASLKRRRCSVIARIGAEPVPVQIIRMFEPAWLGIRKRSP